MIMVSPTGARLTKRDHPMVPLTVPEIVTTSRACVLAGAEALHLHVPDGAGNHSLDVGRYSEDLTEIDTALPGFPVQITTESANRFSPSDQLRLLRGLAPKWASIAVREVMADATVAQRVYDVCADTGTRVQHIVYDAHDIQTLRACMTRGAIPEAPDILLVLGSYAQGRPATVDEVLPRVSALPERARWMLCAFGPNEHACLHTAALLGGDLRVGFENSLTQADGTVWASVEASVAALCAHRDPPIVGAALWPGPQDLLQNRSPTSTHLNPTGPIRRP